MKDRKYSIDALSDARTAAEILSNASDYRRCITTLLTNAFLSGMEAQRTLDNMEGYSKVFLDMYRQGG